MEREKADPVTRPKQMDNFSTPPESRRSIVDASTNDGGPNPQHRLFCRMVGMPENFGEQPYPSLWNIFSGKEKIYKGLYPRVRRAYQWHTLQYWFVACLSNAMLWLQICFGAVLTALGGIKSDKVSVAIIVLGTIQTVMGGFITYFKSRNQPNRTRQFRVALSRVLDAIENAESMLRDKTYIPPPYTPIAQFAGSHAADSEAAKAIAGATVRGVEGMVLRLMDMYQEATNEAQTNYPDFWSTSKRMGDEDRFMMTKQLYDHLKSTGAATYVDAGSRIVENVEDAAVSNTIVLNRLADGRTVPYPTAHGAAGTVPVSEPIHTTNTAQGNSSAAEVAPGTNTVTSPRNGNLNVT